MCFELRNIPRSIITCVFKLEHYHHHERDYRFQAGWLRLLGNQRPFVLSLSLLCHWVTSNLRYPFLDGHVWEGKIMLIEYICNNYSTQLQFQARWLIQPARWAEMRRWHLCVLSQPWFWWPSPEGHFDWSLIMCLGIERWGIWNWEAHI